MIVASKTPYRISFAGGLSDLEDYYKYKDGHVISTTIDKYVYLFISDSPYGKYRLVHKKVEEVDDIDDIQHPLIRESLKLANITKPIEVMALADIPGGTGLGSSSAFTVGLLNALYTHKGINFNKYKLAEDACKIEIDILEEPIGKQDQYNCSFGGLNHYVFTKRGIKIHPILADNRTINEFQDSLMLLYTNIKRMASSVLTEQKENMEKLIPTISDMTWIAQCISTDLHQNKLNSMGYYINKEWELKKTTGNVSNKRIDSILDMAINAGAEGGKITGAGSGGFLLLYCDKDKQDSVRKALPEYKECQFQFEEFGSRIIYEKT